MASRRRAKGLRAEFSAIDLAVYRAVADTSSPTLDAGMSRLTNAANHSRLWLGMAAGLALLGGRRQRRAAAIGVAAIALTSAVVNLAVKPAFVRARPQRTHLRFARVRMPSSGSFPSGHSASAFAFASAVGGELPALAVPLGVLASTVAYSRVHTGVHFPGDVVAGSIVGALVGAAVRRLVR